jgi:hypothetical protein
LSTPTIAVEEDEDEEGDETDDENEDREGKAEEQGVEQEPEARPLWQQNLDRERRTSWRSWESSMKKRVVASPAPLPSPPDGSFERTPECLSMRKRAAYSLFPSLPVLGGNSGCARENLCTGKRAVSSPYPSPPSSLGGGLGAAAAEFGSMPKEEKRQEQKDEDEESLSLGNDDYRVVLAELVA